MRFGSVDTFMEFGGWEYRMGRPIANEGFLKALLTYGTYDSYEFFCPDVHHMERFRERLESLVPSPELLSRVEVSLHVSLAESLETRVYDVFHLGDFTYFLPHLVLLRNRKSRKAFPVTGVTHSLDGVFMNLRYMELLLAGLTPYDGVVCTSRCALEAVRKGLYEAGVRLKETTGAYFSPSVRLAKIPLGVDETFFDSVDRREARAYFRIPMDWKVCLTVGRISPRQKTDLTPVIEMFSRIFSESGTDRWIWLIAGGGDDGAVKDLEALLTQTGLGNRVVLFPNFPEEAKTKLYGASDFYLSAVDNFQETFGLSVVEAMACGLPVICSDFSGYRDLVVNGRTGYLVETVWPERLPGFVLENLGVLDESLASFYMAQCVALDLGRLEDAILKLFRDDDARMRMGREAQRRARAYRWREVIGSYESFWDELRQEARKAEPRGSKAMRNPLVSDPSLIFSHYPTRRLKASDRVTRTPLGKEALKGAFQPLRYEDARACLFDELEGYLLRSMESGDMTVEGLRDGASEALGATKRQVDFHLLWMMKHGLVECAQAGREKGEDAFGSGEGEAGPCA